MGLGRLIADLFTGGDYSKARSDSEYRRKNWVAEMEKTSQQSMTISMLKSQRDTAMREVGPMMDALQQIAALETPYANATVRKMARIAREATK